MPTGKNIRNNKAEKPVDGGFDSLHPLQIMGKPVGLVLTGFFVFLLDFSREFDGLGVALIVTLCYYFLRFVAIKSGVLPMKKADENL